MEGKQVDMFGQQAAYGLPEQEHQPAQYTGPVPTQSYQMAPAVQQQPVQMVMMTPELVQAKQDFHDLKDLKDYAKPQSVYCPMCEHRGETTVKDKRSQVQWLSCLGCVCCGCWMGCCLLPFCVKSMADSVHYCSSCKHPLGKKGVKLC